MEKTLGHDSRPFFSIVRNRLKFRLFLLKNLPAALYAGLTVLEADDESATVLVPYKWFTRNPFRSTYFACLAMAAEMSTGLLALASIYKRQPKVSMLVVGLEGKFYKKATGRTRFVCSDGRALSDAVEAAISTGNAQSVSVLSSGYSDANELISEFWITWSFKAKTASNALPGHLSKQH